MDITQILLTVGAVVGIIVVAVLAIAPTVLEIPSPDEVGRQHRPHRRRHLRVVGRSSGAASPKSDDWHLAA